MRRTHFILFACIATSLFVGWLSLARLDSEPAGATDEPAGSPTGVGGEASAKGPSTDAPQQAEERETRSDLPAGNSANGALRVRVVERASGASVRDAEVRFATTQALGEWAVARRRAGKSFRDNESALDAIGTRAHSDAEGWVVLPRTSATLRCCARSGRLYGECLIAATSAPPLGGHQLALSPDRTLRVRVLDAADRPVVGIGVRLDALVRYAIGGQPGPFQRVVGTTGDDGTAEIRHVQHIGIPWLAGSDGRRIGRITLNIPGGSDPGVAIDPDEPPEHPVTLRMPPTGTVRVEVHDEAGRTSPLVGRVVLLPDSPHRTRFGFDWPFAVKAPQWIETLHDGAAEFPRVALHRRFTVHVLGNAERMHAVFEGPTSEHEPRVVVLPHDDGRVALVGRALDAKHQPLADTALQLWLRRDAGTAKPGPTCRTDAAGRFTLEVERDLVGALDSLEFRLAASDRNAGAVRVVGPRLQNTTSRRAIEIGELVFEPQILLIAGRIVDEHGAGVRSATGTVEVLRNRFGEAPQWTRFVALPAPGPDGSFTVHAVRPDGATRLVVHSPDHLPQPPLEFRPGADRIRVVLSAAGSVQATVRIPQRTPRGALQLLLHPIGAEPSDARVNALRGTRSVDRGGEFFVERWQRLAAGRYTVEMRSITESLPLERHTVEVRTGRIAELEFDLSTRLHTIQITVETPDGAPATESGAVFVLGAHAHEVRHGVAIERGVVRLVRSTAALDLWVVFRGHPPETLRGVDRDATVRLRAPVELELVVPTLDRALPPGVELVLELSRHRADLPRLELQRGAVWGRPTAPESLLQPRRLPSKVSNVHRFACATAGPYSLRVTVRREGVPAIVVAGTRPGAVEAGPRRVALEIPDGAIESALQQLGTGAR